MKKPFWKNNFNRASLPYRSGRCGNVPLTFDLLAVALAIRSMRLRLELYMPRDKTRWN